MTGSGPQARDAVQEREFSRFTAMGREDLPQLRSTHMTKATLASLLAAASSLRPRRLWPKSKNSRVTTRRAHRTARNRNLKSRLQSPTGAKCRAA